MIEILATGGMSTVQDSGRQGYRRFGVGVAGPLDPLAAGIGNAMLGNESGCAFIEIVLFPFRARFAGNCRIALTGADARASLDGGPVWPWWTLSARAGQILHVEGPRGGGVTYLCVGGGLDVPKILGSRSTDLKAGFGGFHGRTLRKGDILGILPDPELNARQRARGFGIRPPSIAMELCEDPKAPLAAQVRILPAAEWDCFTDKSLELLVTTDWRISPNSNRIGARLDGPELVTHRKLEMPSHGIVPGVIQVPPAGRPIVMQCDAQTSGGYPKIATVIEADQWRVAQSPPGGHLRFRTVSLHEAQDALNVQREYLIAIERAARLAQ
jgi:biotin-dependent carboxylase-like uncharacterized protein